MPQLPNLKELIKQVRGRKEAYEIIGPRALSPQLRERIASLSKDIYLKSGELYLKRSKGKEVNIDRQFPEAIAALPFFQALLEYDKVLKQVKKVLGLKGEKWRKEVTQIRKSQTLIGEWKNAIHQALEEASDRQLFTEFLTDYDTWGGGKKVDRSDFRLSAVTKALGVPNNSLGDAFLSLLRILCAPNSRPIVDELERAFGGESPSSAVNLPEQRNLIIYGAPGTGKSYYLKSICKGSRSIRTVFHRDYSNSDFVGSYRPVPVYQTQDNSIIEKRNGSGLKPLIDYRFVPGPFTLAFEEAVLHPEDRVYLIIEEINRGDAAAIFGELFQLLDRDSSGRSEFPITPDEDLRKYLEEVAPNGIVKDMISLPDNLFLCATMNSADQGVQYMDSAFKRRWSFQYMPLEFKGSAFENEKVHYAGTMIPWRQFAGAVNMTLAPLEVSEDRLIGPYFLGAGEHGDPLAVSGKLLMYLWDDVLRHGGRDRVFDIGSHPTFGQIQQAYLEGRPVFCKELNEMILSIEEVDREPDEEPGDGPDDEPAAPGK